MNGQRELRIEAVREGIAWFADYGSQPLASRFPTASRHADRSRRHAARTATDRHRQLRRRDAERANGGRRRSRDRGVLGGGAAGKAPDRGSARRPASREAAGTRTAEVALLANRVEPVGTRSGRMARGPLDVFHFSDWMYPPQRGGVRATTIHDLFPLRYPDWVHPADLPDALAEVRARGADVRPDRRQLRVHRRRGRGAARISSRADLRRAPRYRPVIPLGRAVARPRRGRTCSPSRHSSGARTSRRCSRRCRSSGRRIQSFDWWSSAHRAGKARASMQRASCPSATSMTRSWRSSTEAPGLRLPLAVRGLRHADRRSDGVRYAGRRLGSPLDGRGQRGGRSARGSRKRRGDRHRIERALGEREALSEKGGAFPSVHGARPGRGDPRRVQNHPALEQVSYHPLPWASMYPHPLRQARPRDTQSRVRDLEAELSRTAHEAQARFLVPERLALADEIEREMETLEEGLNGGRA